MREQWERHTAVLTLRPEEAAALLRPAFPGAQVAAVTPAAGGKANTNLKLDLAGDSPPLLLRLFVRDPAAGAKEAAILRRLAGRVPVPRLHHFAETNPITGHSYAVLDWVEGWRADKALADADITEIARLAGDLGTTLAAIGDMRFPQPGFLAPDLCVAETFAPGADGFLGFVAEMTEETPAALRLGEALRESLLRFCEREAGILDAMDPQPRLVHCDFDPSNILVKRRGSGWQVTAVIDWEFALAASPLVDLGHLLRPPQGDVPGFADALAGGYREAGGVLPESWLPAAKLLDLLAWLDFLNRPGDHPRLFADARRTINDTLARWPCFAA